MNTILPEPVSVHLNQARWLASKGFSVIPVKAGTKEPAIDWKRYQTEHPTDNDLHGWFAGGICDPAVVIGPVSGVVVVDVDNPDDFPHDVPTTLTAKTPRGFHHYFRHPGGDFAYQKHAWGDVRGKDRYVVAPPGVGREWLSLADLAPLPPWAAKAEEKSTYKRETDHAGTYQDTQWTWGADVERFAYRHEGDRNHELLRLSKVARNVGVPRDVATRLLASACRANGLMSDGDKAFTATFESGWGYGSEPKGMSFQCFSEVEKRRVQWLWRPFLHRGAINLLTGAPGGGKSTITCEIAAALSTARPLPGETEEMAKERGPLNTLLMNAEDDPCDTIVWRLENQRADLHRVIRPSQIEAIDAKNVAELTAAVKKYQIALVVIDPIQAWCGADLDIYRPNHVRAWGNLLLNMCQETGCTVLFVRHRRKGEFDDINSGLGSIDFSGIARSELTTLVSRRSGLTLKRIKGNVGPSEGKVHYAIEDTDNEHGRLIWSAQPLTPKGLEKRDMRRDKDEKLIREAVGRNFEEWRDNFGKGDKARQQASRARKSLVDKGFRVVDGVWEEA